ncbi:MAG: DUF1236 domain-containing protein [Pseudolabrys sp.]|nr:DUF1236 domain-containing protein [Pseudolabrys sp.]
MQTRSTCLIATATAAALSLSAFGASAATVAAATTPLNIRTGPGPQYPVIGAIPDKGQATISGCIAGSRWCQVNYSGKQGWAYSQYLVMNVSGQTMSVSQARDLPPVTYTAPAATVGSTVLTPTISGDFIAPVATTPPLSIAPLPPTVQTYVVDHPVTPVYLNGEVVQGAGLPPNVVLAPVPDSDYNYAYVNGVPVLVEPTSRRVTYIYR